MKQTAGFTLIELLVATMVASILGALLFAAFYQINRQVPIIDTRTGLIEKAALVNAQLEKDLTGVVAPPEFYARQPKPKEKPGSANEEKDAQKKNEEVQKKSAETDKKKPLEKLFYSTNKNGMLDQLSFITTSALQVYWGDTSGSPKPRMVRVTYVLKENPTKSKDEKKSYALIRKESSHLEFDEVGKASQEYVIADGIKSLTVDYTALLQEPEKKEPAQKSTKKEKEIEQTDEWGKKQKEAAGQDEKNKNEKKLPLVPQIASFDISFWDAQKKRSMPFVFTISIPSTLAVQKASQDYTGKMLGSLKELFGQSMPQQKPTQMAQNSQSPFTFGRGSRR